MPVKKISSRKVVFAATLCISCALLPSVWAAKSGGMSVLIIGDSNTEFGRIAVGLTDTLQSYYGVSGSGYGYIPMFSTFLALRDNIYKGDTVVYNTQWKLYDMFEGSRPYPKPYLSPNGHWLKSSTLNATATVKFLGNGIDIYSLAQSSGGSFSISVDNIVKDTVNTAGQTGTLKTSITGLSAGRHSCVSKIIALPASGAVTLLGFDGHNDVAGKPRSVVHNWGNGYCATIDFVNIDSTIFATALQKLAPDVIVVLLGTNDYLQDKRSAADVKANLKIILNRIKAANVTSKILEVSTFMTNNKGDSANVVSYRANAWPQAASETGVQYWDMSTWFGPYNTALMGANDPNHCNDAGGKKIGIEMLRQILLKFPPTSIDLSAPKATVHTVDVDYRAGIVSIKTENAKLYEIEMFSLMGQRVVRISGTQAGEYPVGKGVLAAPSSGTYIVNVRTNNLSYSWNAVILR